MADDDEDEDAPVVELGPGDPVEGAPLARVSSRLTWPIQKSRVEELEGDSVIRTPEGPRELSAVLPEVEDTYFDRRSTFESAVRDVVGRGPIPTAGDGSEAENGSEGKDDPGAPGGDGADGPTGAGNDADGGADDDPDPVDGDDADADGD